MTRTKARGAGREEFHIQVVLAGREGTQEEYETKKRAAIRKCKNLVKQGDFGSAGSVTMLTPVNPQDGFESGEPPKRTLIFQCHQAKTKKGATLVLKVDEL